MNVPNMRGKKQTFTYGNDSLSITELLRKPEIVGYLEKDGPLTYGSQQEKLRKLLREGRINLQLVMEHAAQNPTVTRVQDTRYGTQRRRANLPRKTTKGEVLFGSELLRRPRRPVHHRRRELDGPPGIGAVSPNPRISPTGEALKGEVLTGEGESVVQEG